jgi:hypothetical protein
MINWDLLLPHVASERLIWWRLNRMGWRVGLFELLGVFLSPRLEGFSLTKHIGKLGLPQSFRWGLTHFPPHLGRCFEALKQHHGYPCPLREHVADFRPRLAKPLREHDLEEVYEVMRRCRYPELIERADEGFRRMLALLREILVIEPVQVLFLHTGYIDLLLHLFLGMPAHEREVMAVLRGFLEGVRDQLGAEELLVFSDHGMTSSIPHEAEGVIHRTDHRRASAVVMGTGQHTCAYLERTEPQDLTAVYDAVVHVSAHRCSGGEVELTAPPPSPRCRDCQLEAVIAQREGLLKELDHLLAEVERQRELQLEDRQEQLAEVRRQLKTSEETLRREAGARARGPLSRPLEALTTRLRRLGL